VASARDREEIDKYTSVRDMPGRKEAVFTSGEDFRGYEYYMLTTFDRDETGKPVFSETQQGQSEGAEGRFASWYRGVNLDPEVINQRNENPEDRERRIRTLSDIVQGLGLAGGSFPI